MKKSCIDFSVPDKYFNWTLQICFDHFKHSFDKFKFGINIFG